MEGLAYYNVESVYRPQIDIATLQARGQALPFSCHPLSPISPQATGSGMVAVFQKTPKAGKGVERMGWKNGQECPVLRQDKGRRDRYRKFEDGKRKNERKQGE